MKRMFLMAFVPVSFLMFAGCKSDTLLADYIVPPTIIKDVKLIDTMEIIPKVSLSGNSLRSDDQSYICASLHQTLSSKLSQCGYINTVDYVWGNPEGVSALEDLIHAKNSQHGYVRHSTDPVSDRAHMYLDFKVNVSSGATEKKEKIELKDDIYRIKYEDGVPYQEYSETRTSTVEMPTSVFSITGTGSLTAKLVDKSGKTVYTKTFSNLSYSYLTSSTVHDAPPPASAVVLQMILPAIETIVTDISPHKVQRELEINSSGSKKSVLLLKSMAFTEAINAIDELDEKSSADYENLGIAYEIIGDYVSAKECFEHVLKDDSTSELAKKCVDRIDSVLSGKQNIRNMNIKQTGNQFKSSEYEGGNI